MSNARNNADARQGSHPEIERLTAWPTGDLPPAEAEQLRGHLAACSSCRDLLAELESFHEPPRAQEVAASEFERAAVWRALQPQLRTPRVWRLPSLVAAALLAVVLGLAAWAAVEHHQASALRQQLAEIVGARPNAPTYNLDPPVVVRGAVEDETVVEVPAGDQLFTLVFGVVDPREFAGYRADFVDAAGETALSIDGLRIDAVGTLTLGLSRHTLPAGSYEVRLYGAGAAGDELVHEYPLRLIYH